jgi:hypothetical protein
MWNRSRLGEGARYGVGPVSVRRETSVAARPAALPTPGPSATVAGPHGRPLHDALHDSPVVCCDLTGHRLYVRDRTAREREDA